MARAAGLSNKGSRQTLAGLSLDEEMDCAYQHPEGVLLDESKRSSLRNEAQLATDEHSAAEPQAVSDQLSAVSLLAGGVWFCGLTSGARNRRGLQRNEELVVQRKAS